MPDVDLAEPVRTGVLGRGLGLIWRAIREQPRIFAVALLGSAGFGGLTVASAFVVGEVVGEVVVPAFDTGRAAPGGPGPGRRGDPRSVPAQGLRASSAAASAPARCSSACRPSTAAG